MTEVIKDAQKALPQPVYLKDYKPPIYWIDEIKMHIDLYDDHTFVKSNLFIRRLTQENKPLILNGEGLTLDSISVNGVFLSKDQYELTDKNLQIFSLPKEFELETICTIHPEKNTALRSPK